MATRKPARKAAKKAVKKSAKQSIEAQPKKPAKSRVIFAAGDVISGDFTAGHDTGTLVLRYVHTGTTAAVQPGDTRTMSVNIQLVSGVLIITMTD